MVMTKNLSSKKGIFSWFSRAPEADASPLTSPRIGIIAGSSTFPLLFAQAARRNGLAVVAVAHTGETDDLITEIAHRTEWVKVGELGKIIDTFKKYEVTEVALAGGINRIRLFGGVKLDARGAKLLARLRSVKDDIIMRGIADELLTEGITVIECTRFMEEHLAPIGQISRRVPNAEEAEDIQVGIDAVRAMSEQDIGQTVVVREGIIVAVEAVEGTDKTIKRGGELGGAGTVVVKFSKTTQDLRFDVPTIGLRTIEGLIAAKAKVLAVEATRCLILDREHVVRLADQHGIAIIGAPPLERAERGRVYAN